MKKNECKHPEGFDDLTMRVTLPRRDYRRMSRRQLAHEGRRMYANLQAIWRAELRLPSPNWEILESVTDQLQLFEEHWPEVCQP